MKKIKEIVREIPQHWVGDGFPVRSLFSYAGGNLFDPFLLLDYAGPHRFDPTASQRGVGEHPHRGFETVTMVYAGELEHRDSTGSHGTIGPGDVQWMTAGSGVVHEEFHSRRFAREGGTLEMVQLWVNLPAQAKKLPPRYQELRESQFPVVKLPDDAGTVRVIAGEFLGAHGPARTVTPLNVWDIKLLAGRTLHAITPEGHTTILIVQSGGVVINNEPIRSVELVLFERSEESLTALAESDARILVLTGEPLNEPIYGQGPFVMNSREEIHQAMLDYQSGRMGALT